MEREVLWRIAPHIIRPLRFVLPHHQGLRPAWLLRLGLFLYDHLGGRKLLPATRTLDLRPRSGRQAAEAGRFTTRFEYSDCWVDDARLVVLNARDAAERGADHPHPRTRCDRRAGARRRLDDHGRGRAQPASASTITARLLVNAAGPWVDDVLAGAVGVNAPRQGPPGPGQPHRRRRSSTTTTAPTSSRTPTAASSSPSLSSDDFTLIGTTDRDYHGDPGRRRPSRERDRLSLRRGQRVFPPSRSRRADVVWTYSGVRPLYDDGAIEGAGGDARLRAEARRAGDGAPPLLNVFGGKITTYRRLAEAALEKLAPHLRSAGASRWTGDGAAARRRLSRSTASPRWSAELQRAYPFLDAGHRRRLVRAYGTRAREIARRRAQRCRSRPALRRRPDRSARSRYLMRARMGADAPRTCCGAAPSSACAARRTRRPRSTTGWRRARLRRGARPRDRAEAAR